MSSFFVITSIFLWLLLNPLIYIAVLHLCRVGALIEGKQQNDRFVSSPRSLGQDDIRQNKLLESLASIKPRIIHSANRNLVSRHRAATLMDEAKSTSVSCIKQYTHTYTYVYRIHIWVYVRDVRRRCSYIGIIAAVIIIIPSVCAGAIRHGQFS